VTLDAPKHLCIDQFRRRSNDILNVKLWDADGVDISGDEIYYRGVNLPLPQPFLIRPCDLISRSVVVPRH